jgi:hypothetical protein
LAEHYGFDETLARRKAGGAPLREMSRLGRFLRALSCLVGGHDCNQAHTYRTGWAICLVCDGLFLCAGHLSNG